MKFKICILLFICIFSVCSFWGCNNESVLNNNENGEISEKNEDISDDNNSEDNGSEQEEETTETYSITEMTVERDGLSIYGKLYKPNKDEIMPAVILSHSAMLTSNSMQSYAKEFAGRGFIAFAFDFCGGSRSSKSTDTDMTIFSEVADLKAVIDAISVRDDVDSSQIYLFGTSQGGLVTALTANDYCDKIEKVILLYPAFNIPEDVQNITYNFFYGLFGYSEQFIETLQGYDAYEHISWFEKPVLIIHGTKDSTVDISYSERAQAVYADCTLKTIEGANHGFNSENNFGFGGNYDDQVWEYIDAFLN